MTKEQLHKKLENYWFYYKIHTIVAILVIAVMAVFISECANRVIPDMTVMVVSKSLVLSEDQTTKIQDMLSQYTDDVNNDGKNVAVLEVLTINEDTDMQMAAALRQKLMAEFATSNNTIFITDDEFFNYLNGEDNLLCDLSTISSNVSSTNRIPMNKISDFDIDDLQTYYGNLTLSARTFSGKSPVESDNKEIINQVNVLKKLLESYKA